MIDLEAEVDLANGTTNLVKSYFLRIPSKNTSDGVI